MRPSSTVFVCILLSGCGRIGFGATPAGGDGAMDGGVQDTGARDGAVETGPPEDVGPPDASVDGGEPVRLLPMSALCDEGARWTVITNGIAADDDAGVAIANAVGNGCGLPGMTTVEVADQSDPSNVDSDTGRPLDQGTPIIIAGGDGPHRTVRYLLASDTPLVWSGVGSFTYVERNTGRLVASGSADSTHDFIMIQMVFEPIDGSTILSVQGLTANGTLAGAFYFERDIAPRLPTDSRSWLVVEWTDDGDGTVDDGDSFTVVDSL